MMMVMSLRSGVPRTSGTPQIVDSELRKAQGNQQQLVEQVSVSELFAGARGIVVSSREQRYEIRRRSSSRSKYSPDDQRHWTRVKFPGLYTGLKRSSNIEKRCDGVPRLKKDKDLVRTVFGVRNLTSSTSTTGSSCGHDVAHESLYRRFVDYATQQCGQHMDLKPYPVKNEFRELVGKDGKALTRSSAFRSGKIRNFRAADINGSNSIQVLNLVAFPSTAYDLPIFCADLVSFAKKSVIVIDLSTTLYSSLELPTDYKEKYFSPLYPFWKKYSERLPWGGALTSEALEFFSPFVIWSRPIKDEGIDDIVFDAFKDYLHVWLDMVDKAEASKDVEEICKNQAAQHRYMTWRSAKDPGRPLLTRLYGETKCEEYMKEFLFAELGDMGTKTFAVQRPSVQRSKWIRSEKEQWSRQSLFYKTVGRKRKPRPKLNFSIGTGSHDRDHHTKVVGILLLHPVPH